jgi:hypothetical protein
LEEEAMPAHWRSIGIRACFVVAFSAVGVVGSAAMAQSGGTPPNFVMTWNASGDNLPPNSYDPAIYGTVAWGTWELGSPNGHNGPPRVRTGWRYEGGLEHETWTLSWDCVVNENPFVDATINVTNNSSSAQSFWIFMPLPIAPALPAGTFMSGWVSAVVSDNNFNGATFSAGTTPVYEAFIDGSNVANMWGPGFSLAAGPFGSNNADQSFSNVIGPAAMSQIALGLRFDLSPGDSASVTGIFQVVEIPGPAGLGLLAMAGLFGSRRRRG